MESKILLRFDPTLSEGSWDDKSIEGATLIKGEPRWTHGGGATHAVCWW